MPAPILPVTVKLVSVPTEVMLGCAAVVTLPAVVAAPLNVPTNVAAETLLQQPVMHLLEYFKMLTLIQMEIMYLPQHQAQ